MNVWNLLEEGTIVSNNYIERVTIAETDQISLIRETWRPFEEPTININDIEVDVYFYPQGAPGEQPNIFQNTIYFLYPKDPSVLEALKMYAQDHDEEIRRKILDHRSYLEHICSYFTSIDPSNPNLRPILIIDRQPEHWYSVTSMWGYLIWEKSSE